MLTLKVVECDFIIGAKIKVNVDIFNLTIAGNYTKEVPSQHLNQAIKLCTICFLVKTFAYFFFVYEYLDFKQFQPFDVMGSILRVIASLLLH